VDDVGGRPVREERERAVKVAGDVDVH
jgi:hypothetical protein